MVCYERTGKCGVKKMYSVERAIILAAGIGKRMQPVTFTKPKPLVCVNGIRMIDTALDALIYNGISEIYIVVGYLKDQFEVIKRKYPMVQLIENPYYKSSNNISSLYVAREHLKNAIILDGDQVICNKEIMTKKFERSGYNCVWTDEETKEWLLRIKEGVIVECSRMGGKRGWQLYSVSRWAEQDADKLKKHIEYEFEVKQNRDIYWDDIALFCYPQEYELGIMEMQNGDVVEIDDLKELAFRDASYDKYIN